MDVSNAEGSDTTCATPHEAVTRLCDSIDGWSFTREIYCRPVTRKRKTSQIFLPDQTARQAETDSLGTVGDLQFSQ
jgi:hypothetical protein